jgi:hypothetical protein
LPKYRGVSARMCLLKCIVYATVRRI